MNGMAKLLMVLGAVIFSVGFLIHFLKLGKLPGDIVVKKANTTFYFPVVTSIIISIILSAIFYIVGRLK
ncbi:DUF2905 domain-containing protein [Lederbergia lenta]|uniref:Protein of uncharacterized function (DUF2905) n=1 Tax=Lederbergia lenta TaxID=1467 RepID=A0A2X4VZG8_LEDLE|nr:DUF2905 domain-containing protein [Lederbergia lenta]MCM3111293.1 DUF2905 domain-containing protein [Lederbergia lenta]MEC2325318.1 DUF2905 domain-containing protein [Lederbergia lenta]SQI55819.1 Protein of uncharacterised function (DUF2905) [Lederbergia lenta]